MHVLSSYYVASLTEVGRYYEEVGTTVSPFCEEELGGTESKAPCLGYE